MYRIFLLLTAALVMAIPITAWAQISGSWSGKIEISPQMSLRLVLNFSTDDNGKQTVTLDSPDQGAYGIAGEINVLTDDSVNVSVQKIGFKYAGRLCEEYIRGKFRQGMISRELVLKPDKSKRRRPQTPKPPFPYTTKEVTFVNDKAEATLAGTLTLPEKYDRNTPAVLMVSGSGLQNRDEEVFGHKPFAVMADILARHGIASLRYDDRGYGRSTGDATAATTADFAADAAAGIRYLRKVCKFRHIGILGHSEGCTVAFLLGSGTKASRPDFIIAMGAPALRGDTILADQSAGELRRSNIPDTIISEYGNTLLRMYSAYTAGGTEAALETVASAYTGGEHTQIRQQLQANLNSIAKNINPWLAYFVSVSPAESIKDTRCPVMVLYGEKDQQVRPAINEPAMRRLAPTAQIKIYPDLNHIFQHAVTGTVQEYAEIEETISTEVPKDIITFINSQTTR